MKIPCARGNDMFVRVNRRKLLDLFAKDVLYCITVGKKEKDHLEEEAKTLITLGNLLKKKRGPEEQARVEAIVARNISHQEKIEKIEALQQEERQSEAGKTERTYAEEARRLNRFGKADRERKKTRAEKKREKIKNRLYSAPFFRYLFKERPKIKMFGQKTGILHGFRVKRDIRAFFISFYQPLLSDCLNLMNQMMGNAWLYLKKKEYNLIVLFRDFCKQVIEMRFTNFNYKDRNCIDQLGKCEDLFLALHYRSEYIDNLVKSVDELIEKNRRNIPDIETLPKLIRKILTAGGDAYTFYNIILCLNMLKYRKYLNLSDLIRMDLGEIIDHDIFVCSEKTQNDIDRFVNETIERLKLLNQEKVEINRLKEFIHTDTEGQIVLDRLRLFYDQTFPSRDHTFQQDKDNVIPFTKQYIYLFLSAFEPLLNEKAPVSNLGPVRLFKENSFKEKTTKLAIIQQKIESLAFKLPSFTRKRYLQIKNQNRGAIQTEAEVITLIDEAIEYLLDIGKIVERLLRSYNNEEPCKPGEFTAVDISQVGTKVLVFPFANRLKDSNHPFYDKVLFEILSDLVTATYSFASHLQDLSLLHMLGKEQSIRMEIQSRLEKLERIALSDTYNDVKTLLG